MAGGSNNASSHSTEGFTYQVFLSFRGEDVRKTFISHLLNALNEKGVKPFYDDDTLPRGEEIQSKLYEAIEKSKLSIVTFSPGYATSRWCLDELSKIMECRSCRGHIVLPVFHNIDPTHVRYQTGPYEEAFDAHAVKFKDELERVKKWRVALKSAADLAGASLENQANGFEAQFVKQIISEVLKKAHEPQLYIPKYMIMREFIVESISPWLEYKAPYPQIGIIYGPVGVGKTTIAKVVYNSNYYKFDGGSFLAGISNVSEDSKNIILLQKQLIKNVSGARNVDHVHEGMNKVRDAIKDKRILVVLDGVDEMEQLTAIFDFPEWFSPGSKVLVTTSNQRLLNVYEACTEKPFRVRELNDEESTKLFCCHAFPNRDPPPDYKEISDKFIKYCGGLPWAIEVCASLLAGTKLKTWENEFAKLERCPNLIVHKALQSKIDSLDNNDKNVFLHIAHFMVGMKKDLALMILNSCKLSGESGLDILTDKFLVEVDEFSDTLVMHNLIQQVGYEVVRQEGRREEHDELGRRSRLVGHKDARDVLRKKAGTKNIKGLHLVLPDSNDDILSEEQGEYFELSNNDILAGPSRPISQKSRTFETGAFRKMVHLDFLLLENVCLDGDFDGFPTEIKWLLWRGLPLESIPLNIQLDHLVVLDMQNSCLTRAWEKCRRMEELRILDLSYSLRLLSTPDLSGAPQLKCLFLRYCSSLQEIHESLGSLRDLVHLNVEGCERLVNMPKSIYNLVKLTILNVNNCICLERFTVPISVQELNAKNSPSSIFPIASSLPLLNSSLPFSLNFPVLRTFRNLVKLAILNLKNCIRLERFSVPISVQELNAINSPSSISPIASSLPHLNSSLPFSLNFPVLRTLNLARCNISREDVLDYLTCAPSLMILNLSDNPIQKLINMGRLVPHRPLVLSLERCKELESISQLPRLCNLNVEFCSSLKDISFIPCQMPYDQIYSFGCRKLHEINYGYKDRLLIERTDDMDEARANYLGFPGLTSCVHEEDDSDYFGKGFYRGGIYQVILGRNYLRKMFNPINEGMFNPINEGWELRCVVPGDQKCIRGLIIGVALAADNYLTHKGEFPFLRIRIQNITKKWEWELGAPFLGEMRGWERLVDQDYTMTWLTHWRINEHRDLHPGDILNINYSDTELFIVDLGVKFLYEEEKDVPAWYKNAFSFHHPDLSMYDRSKSLYPFEGLSDLKQYVVTHHIYQ